MAHNQKDELGGISYSAKSSIDKKGRSQGQGKRTMSTDNGVRANNRRNQFAKASQPTLASVKESLDEREAGEHSKKKVNEVDKGTSTSPENKFYRKGDESLHGASTKSDKTSAATEDAQLSETDDEPQLKDSCTEPSTTSDTKSSVIPDRESTVTSVTKSSVTNGEGFDEASSRRSSTTSDMKLFASQTSLSSDTASSVTSLTKPAATRDERSADLSDRRSSTTSDTQRLGSQASLGREKKSCVTSDIKSSATKDDRRSSTTSYTTPETSEKSERRSSVSSVRSGRSSVVSNRKSSVTSNKRTSVSYGANESGADSRKSSVTSTRRDSRASSNIKTGNSGSSNKTGPKRWMDAFTKSNHAFSPKQGRRQSGVGNSVELSERDRKREAEMIFWKLDMEDIMLRLRRINRSLDAHLKRLSARETTGIGLDTDK